jgi:3-polyprenyl-4-hydroxybenzoate decarboxylase
VAAHGKAGRHQKRYGGFAKAVGMRVLTTPHGLGYAATVIVVDEDVNPFDLPQVMWALSTKMNPAGDLIHLPNLSVVELGERPARDGRVAHPAPAARRPPLNAPIRRTRRDAYPEAFRVTLEDIRSATEVPPVPPLRTTAT